MFQELSIVNTEKSESMLVSWDMGRRCNYDCTYCPSHRHDNFSPHASMEELQSSGRFVLDYLALMMPFKKTKYVSVSFTGGEPTVNPNFVDFGQWLMKEFNENYSHIFDMGICLTTNGAMSRKMCDSLLENYNFATISYHCEGKPRLKKMVMENIEYLKSKDYSMKVNVMFHARPDYFDECLKVCETLERTGVDYVPRLIGEHDDNNRYNHKYTEQQLKWMKDFWDKSKPRSFALPEIEQKSSADEEAKHKARSLGRPCCGKRPMHVCDAEKKNWEKTSFLKFAKFKDWSCSVNWFFLHIEQQSGLVYHHQTCQANFGGKREPLGHIIKDSERILSQLRSNIENKTMPIIVCPNKLCGCGLCTPKSRDFEDLAKILPEHVNTEIFAENPLFKELNQEIREKEDQVPTRL